MPTSRRDPSPATPPRRRAARDRGASFVEVVITVALTGLLVVPIMSAVATLGRASSTAQESASVETALINAVDRVNRAPSGQCDYRRYAEAAMRTQGWEPTRVRVTHAYLDGDRWVTGPDGAAACPPDGRRPRMIQLVDLSVSSPDGRVTRSVQVVKSDV